ncbi:MAG: hypothetical protein USCAAHI_00924 [Beijerinckiaceae bacterium]|nr:MAG: hypothetical protein USCAAHI_00924 [Beijerinckiaceae bacterium]
MLRATRVMAGLMVSSLALGTAAFVSPGRILINGGKMKALAQSGYSSSAIGLVDVPGALADRRDVARRGTEPAPFHACPQP